MEEKQDIVYVRGAVIFNQMVGVLEVAGGFAGGFVFGATALYSTGDGQTELDIVIILYILAAIAAAAFINGILRFKLIHELREYIPILSSDPEGSVKNLSFRTGVPAPAVAKRLRKMLRKGYIKGAYYDASSGKFIFQNRKNVYGQDMSSMGNTSIITVECRNCGALNRVNRGSVKKVISAGKRCRDDKRRKAAENRCLLCTVSIILFSDCSHHPPAEYPPLFRA